MGEFLGYLILAVLGFVIGGAVGVHLGHGFHPTCWYGTAIALGVCVCCNSGGFDFD